MAVFVPSPHSIFIQVNWSLRQKRHVQATADWFRSLEPEPHLRSGNPQSALLNVIIPVMLVGKQYSRVVLRPDVYHVQVTRMWYINSEDELVSNPIVTPIRLNA